VNSHFLSISTPNIFSIPGSERDDRDSMQVFPDLPMNRFRVVPTIHDITTGLPDLVTLSKQFLCVPGIMNPAFRCNEPGDYLILGINGDRRFQEMFPDLAGSGGVIMARISAGESG